MQTVVEVNPKRKRKKDPTIIRVDDAVKITTPKEFVRCGYPMAKNETESIIIEEYGKDIHKIIEKIYKDSTKGSTIDGMVCMPNRMSNIISIAKSKITSELAVIKMYAEKFGGNERKIYTKEIPEYKGLIGRVSSIRFVKTGVRIPSCGGSGYEYEFEPPHLSGIKTHKILSVNFYTMDGAYEKEPPHLLGYWRGIDIEAKNVEKIHY